MIKRFLLLLSLLMFASQSFAAPLNFDRYFKVDMKQELPDVQEYIKKIGETYKIYDKGYISRFNMGKTFNKSFGQDIKSYGLSEGRIKNSYEDDLLEIISWLPKETYQYIGPVLHQVPGMSEKILNLPGIKETKNKFPEEIAGRFRLQDDVEFMSPALYFLLMPEIWGDKKLENLDKPENRPVKKPKMKTDIPDFLKQQMDLPVKTAEKKKSSVHKKASAADELQMRTVMPTLTSPLTLKDAEAFVATIDEVIAWGMKNNMRNLSKLINAGLLLDMWENEQGVALTQNSLKDAVNPCQRLVLKIRFAELYNEFASMVVKQGFSPEEWAYTCDKTLKAFRASQANPAIADAVRWHRRGYLNSYFDSMPSKWRAEMYATQAAIVKMYAVFKEDIKTIAPVKEELRKKLMKNKGMILTAPVIY